MLRKVGHVYRQPLLQAAIHHEHQKSIHFHRTLYHFIHSASISATAFPGPRSAIRNHAKTPIGVQNAQHENHSAPINTHLESGCSQASSRLPDTLRSHQQQSNYPPEVLSIIDAFFTWKTRDEMMEGLETIKNSPSLFHFFRDRDIAKALAEAMAGTELPQRAYRVLVVAHELGCCFTPSHYEHVVYRLATSKQWSFIPPLVSLAKRRCGRMTTRLMDWRTRALVENFQYARLEQVLGEYTAEDIKPTSRTYHLLISGHLRNHNLTLAKQYMQKMIEAGFRVDASTRSVIVSVYRSLGQNVDVQAEALEVLRELDGRAATTVLNSIIQQRLDNHDFRGAIRFVKRYYRLKHVSVEAHAPENHNTHAIEHSSEQISPSESSSHSSNVYNPDATTFTILIKHIAQRRELRSAIKLLEYMTSLHIKPDPGLIAALIQVYCVTDNHGHATTIIASMCKFHDITVFLFSSFLGLRCSTALPIDVCGITPNVDVFNSALHGLLAYRGINAARTVLKVMRINGIRPNQGTVEVIMNYLDKAERARPRELLRVLRHLSLTPMQPTLRHVHIILRAILRREKYLLRGSGWNVTAAKISSQRQDNSKYPTGKISDTLVDFDPLAGIQVPQHLHYRSMLLPLLRSLSRRHVRGDRATFALRIKHEAVSKLDLEKAKEVFQFMIARGFRPNEYHYAALMEGYAHQGDMQRAEEVFHSAERAGVKLNVVMYTILITGYARQGRPEAAVRTFQSMISASIQPDVPSIDAVTSAYFAVGAYRLAKELLVELWSFIRPFPKELRRLSLKELARMFRSYHETSYKGHKTLPKQDSRMLRWKLQRIIRRWDKYWKRPPDWHWAKRFRGGPKSSRSSNPHRRQ